MIDFIAISKYWLLMIKHIVKQIIRYVMGIISDEHKASVRGVLAAELQIGNCLSSMLSSSCYIEDPRRTNGFQIKL